MLSTNRPVKGGEASSRAISTLQANKLKKLFFPLNNMEFVFIFSSPQLRGSFVTFARRRKPFQSRSLVRLSDAAARVRRVASRRPGPEGTEPQEGHVSRARGWRVPPSRRLRRRLPLSLIPRDGDFVPNVTAETRAVPKRFTAYSPPLSVDSLYLSRTPWRGLRGSPRAHTHAHTPSVPLVRYLSVGTSPRVGTEPSGHLHPDARLGPRLTPGSAQAL